MIDPSELDKQRVVVFGAESPGQVEPSHQLLSCLPGCKIEYGIAANALPVTSNLHDCTLDELENGLTREGL